MSIPGRRYGNGLAGVIVDGQIFQQRGFMMECRQGKTLSLGNGVRLTNTAISCMYSELD